MTTQEEIRENIAAREKHRDQWIAAMQGVVAAARWLAKVPRSPGACQYTLERLEALNRAEDAYLGKILKVPEKDGVEPRT